MSHEVIWTQPPPAWPVLSLKLVPARAATLQHPVLLRFASDSFMDDFMNVLATEPQRIGEYRVRPETWRGFVPPPEPPKRPAGGGVLRHLRLFRRPGSANRLVESAPLPPPASPPNVTLKLYQPAHQRHYLVTSSLVCRVPGFPDRTVDPARDERAGFVMRRLLPPAGDPAAAVSAWDEYAWVPGSRGAAWRKIARASERSLFEGEDLLPMFGVHCEEAGRRTRRIFAGVVPTGRREAYLGAPKATSEVPAGVTARTARKILLRKEVTEPWKSLVARATQVNASFAGPFTAGERAPTGAERRARLKIEREQIQAVSWLILLDFARYLSVYLPSVWRAVLNPTLAAALAPAQADAYAALENTEFSATLRTSFVEFFTSVPSASYNVDAVAPNLRAALAHYGRRDGTLDPALGEVLEQNEELFDLSTSRTTGDAPWPAFLFPLADPASPANAPLPPELAAGEPDEDDQTPVPPDADATATALLARIDGLATLVVRALEDSGAPVPEPAVPAAAIAPADPLRGWFVIRCVYDRPGCAPLHGAVVSEPTEAFELAGFYDPDAPARPIRIGLPLDTTPAGLRKFDKNTAFVISNTLCGQIRRAKGMTLGDLVRAVLPWPLHKDLSAGGSPCRTGAGLDLGMICSLSIPIITLCALILLIIMVTLLDLIFRWLPFFILCFPVPGLKAKGPPSSP
jgi:hypothetical protein